MGKVNHKFGHKEILTSAMMNKIVGNLDALTMRSSVQFAVGRCIKPTSRIGNLYYFAGHIGINAAFENLDGFDEFVENYNLAPREQNGNQGGINRYEILCLNKGCIVEIIDTPHCRDLSWMRIYLPPMNSLQSGWTIKNLSSPYLEVHNGRVVCTSTSFGCPIWYKPILATSKTTDGGFNRVRKIRRVLLSSRRPPFYYDIREYHNGLRVNDSVMLGMWRLRFMVRNKISLYCTDYRVLHNHSGTLYFYMV